MDMYMDMGINSAQLTELNTLIFYAHGIPAVRVPLRGWEYLFYLTPNKKWKATNGNIPNNSVTSGDINMSTMEFLFMTELEAQDTWIPALNAILDPDLKKQAEFKKHQPHNPLLWEIYLNNLKQANAPLEKELGEALTAINPISSKYASDLLEKYAKVINPIIREDLLCYLRSEERRVGKEC